jgi:hypothetical protein
VDLEGFQKVAIKKQDRTVDDKHYEDIKNCMSYFGKMWVWKYPIFSDFRVRFEFRVQ